MNKKVWLCLAHMSGHEMDFIEEAFETNWVAPLGANVDGFEKDLENFIGENRHIVALSAGTAAIHLGLLQLGIGKGDEVICQSFTFAASANPVVYCGGTPVFVDSEKDTWNMSPSLLEEAIIDRKNKTGKYPKAIIPVHLYGMPAKMDEICAIAQKYNIPILEDAAEGLGSEYKGRKCGTFGEFGALSFNGNKMITTSGGGALICKTEEEKKRTLFYATQAREPFPYYQHEQIGYNYRLSNICAGIGRGQMYVINEHLARHRQIHQMYADNLRDVEGITVMTQPDKDRNANYWLTCILINPSISGFSNNELRLKLDSENIESRHLWKPMHLQPVYRDVPSYVNGISEDIFNQGLCLPSGPMVTDDNVYKIIEIIKKLVRK